MRIWLLLVVLFISNNLFSKLWLPCPKPFSGHIETSAGVHFWHDHVYLRNLQLRSMMFLCPGIRANLIVRANRELNQMEIADQQKPVYNALTPIIDEGYLEFYGLLMSGDFSLNTSLRTGSMRYIKFPSDSVIDRFAHVAGMSDIRNSYQPSGYEGAILITNLKWKSLALHNTVYQKTYDCINLIELDSYLSWQYRYKSLLLEARSGKLPVRDHSSDSVLEESDWGWGSLAGFSYKGYDINLYLEQVKETTYTGLSIKFASSPFTRAAGKLRLDYNRACEGFVFQYPLFYQDINIHTEKPENMVKVGEIKAERVISFWRVGMQRNFYEHIIHTIGNTNPDETVVIIKKEPMLLGIESIVSPVYKFHKFSDIAKWDSQGIRPGILTQTVVYEYYQKRRQMICLPFHK